MHFGFLREINRRKTFMSTSPSQKLIHVYMYLVISMKIRVVINFIILHVYQRQILSKFKNKL